MHNARIVVGIHLYSIPIVGLQLIQSSGMSFVNMSILQLMLAQFKFKFK